MIIKIRKILDSMSENWICFSSNGLIIETTFDADTDRKPLSKMLRILKAIINELEVGNIILIRDLIIYRPTFNIFIFVMGDLPKKLIKKKFIKLTTDYGNKLEDKYSDQKTERLPVNFVLFSIALEEGPTPILHKGKFGDEIAFKVCMKSMLLLSVESKGANKDMLSFQPFIDLNSLGIVYLFQIEDEKARGGAFDAAITVLVDYESRAIVYDNYNKIEHILKKAKRQLISHYYDDQEYEEVLDSLQKKFHNITFEVAESEDLGDLKTEMMEQIKKLSML